MEITRLGDTFHYHLSAGEQFRRLENGSNVYFNSSLWNLHLRGFPVKELAHQYVVADSMMKEYGSHSFEIHDPKSSPFRYPWIVQGCPFESFTETCQNLLRVLLFFPPKVNSKKWLVVQLVRNESCILGDLNHIPIEAKEYEV